MVKSAKPAPAAHAAKAAARALLERLSRGRVLKRRLPPDLGGHTLLVSPDAAMKLWRRDLRQVDPLLLRLARELVRPGATVWDVGANVGLFAAAAAFLAGPAGRVVAVEADGWLAGLLRRSAGTAPADHAPIDVLSAAVAAAVGVADFVLASRGRAANHLAGVPGSTQAGGARGVQKVVTVTLDWLLGWFPAPDLIKIDVEGAELECLRGAGGLLGRERPVILCEIADDNAAAVGRLFAAADYQIYDAAQPPAERRPLAAPVWNTLAVPAPLPRPDAGRAAPRDSP
ncbi:MAG TPA: FkbM family methyltransferase [Thermoanaerobaculia bacterium]|jgi:FkbM family methyltransferase|nr:FkbM family methyltransferase [Thermoanaerobaculia bacterium]